MKNFKADYRAWDIEADRVFPGWEKKDGGYLLAVRMLKADRPFGPNRKASSMCRSGKYDYCTCDCCF